MGDLGLHALLPGHKGRNGAVAADVQCRAHLLVDPRAVGCNLPVAQGNLLCNHRSGNGKLLLIQPCYSHTVQPEGDPVCRIGCKVLGHVHLFVGHAVNGNLGGFQVLAYGNAKDGHIVLVVSDNAAQDVPGRFYPIVVQRVNLALEIVAFHNPAGRSLDVLMYLLLVCAPLALCDVHAVQRRYKLVRILLGHRSGFNDERLQLVVLPGLIRAHSAGCTCRRYRSAGSVAAPGVQRYKRRIQAVGQLIEITVQVPHLFRLSARCRRRGEIDYRHAWSLPPS